MHVVLPRSDRSSCLHADDCCQSSEDQRSTLEIINEPTTKRSENKVRRGETEVDAELRYWFGDLGP